MKRFLLLFTLALTLSFSLISCGDDGNESEVHADADLPLIVDGEANFTIIMADDLPNKSKSAIRSMQYILKTKHNIDVEILWESKSTESEVELLLGNIKSRGEKYAIDGYSYGNEGYAIKLIDKKVVINGGSDEAITTAIKKFSEEIIGTKENEIYYATMREADSFEHIQSDFDVTSLKIDGVDIRSFKISADLENSNEKKAAEAIRESIYLKTGVHLDIVSEGGGDNLILIKKADGDSFTVKAEDKKLLISYSHENLLTQMADNFAKDKITTGALSFTGEVYKKDTSVIFYEDFGAVGDGKTNDFEAIYNAHKTANIGGQTVKATAGKTYYIGSTSGEVAYIKTNVDWTGASFIIDDRGGDNGSVFKITNDSDRTSINITDKSVISSLTEQRIGPGTVKIEIPREFIDNWDGDVMLLLYSSAHKVYRRRGYSSYNGDTQKELVIIDKDGNVSADTPIMFDYKKVTKLYAYRLDPSRAITVEGGKFTTITDDTYSGYITRNISISRSFTTLKNVEHYVEGEVSLLEQANGKVGAAYSAFYSVGSCTNVTLKDCVMTGRRYYKNTGTYEFSASTANKVVLDGCTQSNFWVTVDENFNIHNATKDTPGAKSSQGYVNVNGKSLAICWGAGASNYCKNLEYIDTQLSRLDAHAGVYNAKLIGCEITGIELCGWGTFIMEDTDWYSYGTGSVANSLIYLRNDYGSSWNGVMKIKDVNAYYTTTRANDAYLFYHSYVNWYFGHTSVFPSVEIDNLKCYDLKTKELLDEGYGVILNNNNISASSKMHLSTSSSRPYFSIVDADKDGFIDEPLFDRDLDGKIDEACDLDNDGKVGNTSVSYSDAKGAVSTLESGYRHPTSYVNLNIVKPPEYIKITGNNAGIVFVVPKTAGHGISDGGYYSETDNFGGFFGGTKFYYTDDDYVGGTDNDAVGNFVFE